MPDNISIMFNSVQEGTEDMFLFSDSPSPIHPPSTEIPLLLPVSPASAHAPLASTPVRGKCSANFSMESELLTYSSESPDSTALEVSLCDVAIPSFEEELDTDPLLMVASSDFHPISISDQEIPVPSSQPSTPVSAIQSDQPQSLPAGYKVVFDNIHKTINPRHMTADSQVVSLHYVQAYAVRDRVDYSSFPSQKCGDTNLYDLLPSQTNYSSLKENFAIYICRVIVENLVFFHDDFKQLTSKDIPHKYSKEHSKKSEVVSTCVNYKQYTCAFLVHLITGSTWGIGQK